MRFLKILQLINPKSKTFVLTAPFILVNCGCFPDFRLLAASLKYRENPKWDVDTVRMIAAQCNKQKYNAKKAGELSTELYTLKYIEMHSPLVTEAVVVEVREKYIDVIIVVMGLNRRIFFNNVSIFNGMEKKTEEFNPCKYLIFSIHLFSFTEYSVTGFSR